MTNMDENAIHYDHKVIAISGLKGCGKNTFARAIRKVMHEKRVPVMRREFAYANRLKQAVKIMWDLNEDQIEGFLKEVPDPRWGVTPRRIMQHIRTEHARVLCNDVHRILLERDIKMFQDATVNSLSIVTDLRFENELDGCLEHGYTTILLSRCQKVHSSEQGLFHRESEFDYSFFNDKGVDHWEVLAEKVLEDLGIL